jgi:TonB family protein
MLNQTTMEQEASAEASFLTELELSNDGCLFPATNRPDVKDMILGMGGSALAHALVAIGALLLTFVQSSPPLPGAFLTVNLVERGGNRGGSCDLGLVEGGERGPRIQMPPLAETQPEKALPPEPPKTVKPVKASTEKTLKKCPLPPAVKPGPSAAAPSATSEEPPSVPSPSAPSSAKETAGTFGEEGPGAKGMVAGSGFSSPSGSAAGTGLHPGEFGADAVDQIPQALQKVEPIYPPRARKQGICGKVVLRFLVEPDGHVSRPSILEANPSGYFEQSALDAIRHWRFKPGIYRGRAVATWMVLPVQFKLTS